MGDPSISRQTSQILCEANLKIQQYDDGFKKVVDEKTSSRTKGKEYTYAKYILTCYDEGYIYEHISWIFL